MLELGKSMTVKSYLAFALLALAAGCASNHEKIAFSDEAEIRSQAVTAAMPVAEKRLEPADEARIEQLIFSYLLDRHFWDLADYSAVFLQADDSQVAAMMAKYPNHVPPIKPGKRARLKSHRPPLDKDTKKPAIVLTAEINEPNADATVDAVGRWYGGEAATGFRTFHFKKTDDGWQIAEVK